MAVDPNSITIALSITGSLTAISSLTLSYLNYRRDTGRLDVYIGMGKIHGGTPLVAELDAVHIKIVNSGRRPVMITSFGGDNRWQAVNRWMFGLVPKYFKPKAFMFMGGIYFPALLNAPDGSSKVLQEGHPSQIVYPLPEGKEMARQLSKAGSVYVFDSIGKRHKVKRAVLRKFRSDFKSYLSETNQQ